MFLSYFHRRQIHLLLNCILLRRSLLLAVPSSPIRWKVVICVQVALTHLAASCTSLDVFNNVFYRAELSYVV